MKSVRNILTLISLAALAPGLIAPAYAADDAKKSDKDKKKGKEKAPEAPKLAPSKEFKAVYEPVVAAYSKKSDAAAAVKALESWPQIKAAMKNDDDRYQAGQFANIVGGVAKNHAVRLEGADLLVASPKAQLAEKQSAYYFKGAVAYDAQEWVKAEEFLTQAYNLGFRTPSMSGGVESLIADSAYMQSKPAESLQWAQRSIDGSKVAGTAALTEAFYLKAANRALKTKDYPTISQWWKTLVRAAPKPAYWHDAFIHLDNYLQPATFEALDWLRLLRKIGGLGTVNDYKMYYETAGPGRLSQEVVDVIEEGMKSGVVPKGYASAVTATTDAETKLKDKFSTAELQAQLAGNQKGYDDILDADILMSYREFAAAKSGYLTALGKADRIDIKTKIDHTDRARMGLAIAEVMLGDTAGARADFAKITSPVRREIADYWLIYLDQAAKPAAAPPAPAAPAKS